MVADTKCEACGASLSSHKFRPGGCRFKMPDGEWMGPRYFTSIECMTGTMHNGESVEQFMDRWGGGA